jgi:hypothetical protein
MKHESSATCMGGIQNARTVTTIEAPVSITGAAGRERADGLVRAPFLFAQPTANTGIAVYRPYYRSVCGRRHNDTIWKPAVLRMPSLCAHRACMTTNSA